MKKLLVFLLAGLMLLTIVSAVSNPVTLNGKKYYIVTSTDSTEDSGDEVCTKIGKICAGYSEKTNAVCKQFHPGAADSSSVSGDETGVYCNGAPQNGVCSSATDTCHTCPACSVTVACHQAIGGLYREMYVECVDPTPTQSCKVSLTSTDVNDFFNDIPSLNAQLAGCPISVPKGSGLVLASGNTQVNINMNSGQTKTFYLVINKGTITGIASGAPSVCAQTLTVSENDFNTILQSSNKGNSIAYLVAQKRITLSGCNFLSKARLFFVKPIVKIIAKKQAPTPPAPTPQPNCGQVGEQCNNRACWTGICAAPEENVNGQWRHVNYRCIDQGDWNAYCQGMGNTPAPWHCLTGPCR